MTRLSQAIRAARLATHLTQKQLAARIGVKATAVQRWEAGRNKPPPRRRPVLASAIAALDPKVGARLQAALSLDAGIVAGELPGVDPPEAPRPSATPPARAPITSSASAQPNPVELIVYRMADELDLPPRRMRGALTRCLRSLRATGLSLEQTERALEAWLANVP